MGTAATATAGLPAGFIGAVMACGTDHTPTGVRIGGRAEFEDPEVLTTVEDGAFAPSDVS